MGQSNLYQEILLEHNLQRENESGNYSVLCLHFSYAAYNKANYVLFYLHSWIAVRRNLDSAGVYTSLETFENRRYAESIGRGLVVTFCSELKNETQSRAVVLCRALRSFPTSINLFIDVL